MILKKESCVEFLVVSKSKLKIILDKSEVEKYRLSDFSTGESRELRRRLREILAEARDRVGFDSGGERLLVSYYPTRLAGAELFVTVIGGLEEIQSYYIFSSLDELSRACAAAEGAAEGALYLLPSGEYCLAVMSVGGAENALSEFADEENDRGIAHLLERSRLLKNSGAVATLASLWCGRCTP